MTQLCFAAFANSLQKVLIQPAQSCNTPTVSDTKACPKMTSTDTYVVEAILRWIQDALPIIDKNQAEMLCTSKPISSLINRKIELHTGYRQALLNKKVYRTAVSHFATLKSQIAMIIKGDLTDDIAHINNNKDFHQQIREVIQGQFKKESKELKNEWERLIHASDQYGQYLKQLSLIPSAPAANIRTYSKLDHRIRSLYVVNKAYEDEIILRTAKQGATQELKTNSETILKQVEDSINAAMEHIDGKINSEERTSLKITIHSTDKYSYEIADDSGTGSPQHGLISFNLELLENSLLPAVTHDSMLVRPVEDQSFDGILRVYTRQRKQVFMAIDKISRYSPQTQKNLQDTTFIHLEPGYELFVDPGVRRKSQRINFNLEIKLSYKPLQKLLVDKDMLKQDLKDQAKLSSTTTARLNNGENVTTDIFLRICQVLDRQIADIVKVVHATKETK